jgi:hypothetical protein
VDLIGNPLSFVGSLGTGVKDFFYEPAQGLIKVRWLPFLLGLYSREKRLVLVAVLLERAYVV